MRRLVTILFIAMASLVLWAENNDPQMRRMFECINDSDFQCAREALPLVSDWSNYDGWLLLDQAVAFKNTLHREQLGACVDSLTHYIVREANGYISHYYMEGMYSKAVAAAQLADSLYDELGGAAPQTHAETLSTLGNLYLRTDNYHQAKHYLQEAEQFCRSHVGAQHMQLGIILVNLGVTYESLGEIAAAEQAYLEAVDIQRVAVGENNEEYATAIGNLGSLYLNIGELDKAEKYNLDALRIYKQILGEKETYVAYQLVNVAAMYSQMGNFRQAEKYLTEALEIEKEIAGEEHPDYAYVLHNLGLLYQDTYNYEHAEYYYQKALAIRKATLGEHHPYYAMTLDNLGILYKDQGLYEKAEPYYLEAMEIRKQVYGENHPDYALSLNNIAQLYERSGEWSKAEKYELQTLQMIERLLGKNHSYYAVCQYNVGSIYCRMGAYDKAEPYIMASCKNFKDRFMHSLCYMSEQERSQYWRTIRNKFDDFLPFFSYRYYATNPKAAAIAYDNELFRKGVLLQSTDAVKLSIQNSGDTTLINRWNQSVSLRQFITQIREQQPESQQLREYEQQAEQLEKQVTRLSTAYRDDQHRWQITWDSVRGHLKRKEVAIEFTSSYTSYELDSVVYCALILRRNSKQSVLVPLCEQRELTPYLEANINLCYDYHQLGQPLSELVWSKLQPYLKPGETVYFAPTGLLHQLAIEALPYDENRTMSDVYHMVRLSSTRELALSDKQTAPASAILYGGIRYDVDTAQLAAESRRYQADNMLAMRSLDDENLNRGQAGYLPGTKNETEQILLLLRDAHITASLYTDAEANEESFKSLSGKHSHILHIATHGFFWTDSAARQTDYFASRSAEIDPTTNTNRIDPLNRCGLLFAGANIALQGRSSELPAGVQDGILTAKEISLLDLRDAELVVLSACETGRGEVAGDGVFGLQRAFKMAGAQTIVMSLWPVSDSATQLLMTEFYRNWLTLRQPKRTAFRNAQNAVRRTYEEPVYWAGFVMLD